MDTSAAPCLATQLGGRFEIGFVQPMHLVEYLDEQRASIRTRAAQSTQTRIQPVPGFPRLKHPAGNALQLRQAFIGNNNIEILAGQALLGHLGGVR